LVAIRLIIGESLWLKRLENASIMMLANIQTVTLSEFCSTVRKLMIERRDTDEPLGIGRSPMET
jgi:hypothetical protein